MKRFTPPNQLRCGARAVLERDGCLRVVLCDADTAMAGRNDTGRQSIDEHLEQIRAVQIRVRAWARSPSARAIWGRRAADPGKDASSRRRLALS
jgi:hypothetical protein